MDQENLDYLRNLARKNYYYYNTKTKAMHYIARNKITDHNLNINIFLMSALWASHQLNDTLTEEDLKVMFNFSIEEEEEDAISVKILKLSPHHYKLTLKQLLDLTVETFK